MELARIDFQQLRVKHLLFKTKVRAFLYGGKYDEDFFSVKGPVSIWFDAVGKVRYAHSPEVAELARLHQRLNTAALALYRQYRDGMIDQAHEGFKNIDSQSDQFLAILSKVEQRLSVN